jgi:hypothetical protein
VFADGEAKLTVANATIEGIRIDGAGKTGIMAFKEVRLTVADATITNTVDFGIQAKGAETVSLQGIVVTAAQKSGIQVSGLQSRVTLDGLELSENAECGLILFEMMATVKNAKVTGNTFSGFHLGGATVDLTNGTFTGNKKSGLFLCEESRLERKTARFESNRWAGAVIETGSSLTAAGLKVEQNETWFAIAGDVRLSDAVFTESKHSGLYVSGGTVTVKESTPLKRRQGVIAVASGVIELSECRFEDNDLRAAASEEGEVRANANTSFVRSSSSEPVRVAKGKATFQECAFNQSATTAIFTEGEVNIDNSEVIDSQSSGAVFQTDSSGVITNTKFENNGEVACQVLAGAPTIRDNTIAGHSRSGIFICTSAEAVVERNRFNGR